MNCLIDYIGLRDCSESEPESGMFINSLAGISTALLQKIADNEQHTYANVWGDVQTIAATRLKNSFLTQIKNRYRLKNVRERFEWTPADGGSTEASSAHYRGFYMQFEFSHFTFQAIRIAKLFFRSPSIQASVSFVMRDENGTQLYLKTQSVQAGLNEIIVDQTFSVKRLFIGVDAEAKVTMESDLSESDITCYCQTIRAICNDWDCMPTLAGYTVTKASNVFTKTENNTHGLGVVGYVVCDFTSIVCYNKELFSTPWMYLLGNQILIEVLASDRVGKPTTVDREKYEELRDFYQVQFEKELATAVDGICINTDHDCCIECNDNPKTRVWLP